MTVRDSDTLKSYFTLSKVPVPSQYNDLIDTIFSMSGGGGGGGLHDDRYVKISLQDTITIAHTFNPTVAGPPFVLGANAQYKTVIGFKADQLNKSVIAGNGLTGGGILTSDITLNVGAGDGITVSADVVGLTTPGTLSVSSTNSATGSHTHAITSSSNPNNTTSLLKTDTSGFLNLLRLNVDTLADKSGEGITISPAGDILLDPASAYILPVTNYDLNLGSLGKKYLTLHAAELWVETLVAQETIATIGGRILVGPTTILESNVLGTHSNLALNPGFETSGLGGADVFANWTESAGSGSIVKDATIYWDGLASCKLTPSIGNNTFVYQLFTVTEKTGYSLSFYARGSGTLAGRYGVYDATHSTWIIPLTSTGVTAATWTKVSGINFEIPSTCVAMSIYLYCPSSGTSAVHFDGVTLYSDYIEVKHDQMVKEDVVYLEANGSVEFMRIIMNAIGADPFIYYVERNLDGTGLNAWYAGDAVFNTGTTGDGFIDLYSYSGINSGTTGPTIVGNVRNSTAYNDWSEHWAIGNLNGLYGQGTVYGVGIGNYHPSSSRSYILIEDTNGIRIYSRTGGASTLRAQWDTAGIITIGNTSGEHVVIDATSLKFKTSTTTYGELNSSTWTLGTSANKVEIASTGIKMYANSVTRVELTSGGILYLRDTGGNAVLTFSASDGAEITKKLTMPGTSSAIAIGVTPPTSSSAGTGIWIDRTGFYSLLSNERQLLISTTSGALYAGPYDVDQYPVTVDADGLLFKQDGLGSETASHIRFGSPSSIKAEMYYYYSGAGVFNQLTLSTVPGGNTGKLYLIGAEVIVAGSGTGSGVIISADTGGTRIGTGVTIGDDSTPPPSATIQLYNRTSTPSYYSAGQLLYGKGAALLQESTYNRRLNLSGGGGGVALLTPLTYAMPKALWFVQGSTDYDQCRLHIPISPTSMAASTYKNPISPAPLYIGDFNGSSSYMSAALATYTTLNVNNWFSIGMWVYIDTTGRNHGFACMGTSTVSWNLLWYNTGGYYEFQYYDTGGTLRQLALTTTLTTGWHFIGVEYGWTASGNNFCSLRVDNNTNSASNQAYAQMRAGAGDFRLGYTNNPFYLDGKIATYWLTGYMPSSVGDCLLDYLGVTQGIFWP